MDGRFTKAGLSIDYIQREEAVTLEFGAAGGGAIEQDGKSAYLRRGVSLREMEADSKTVLIEGPSGPLPKGALLSAGPDNLRIVYCTGDQGTEGVWETVSFEKKIRGRPDIWYAASDDAFEIFVAPQDYRSGDSAYRVKLVPYSADPVRATRIRITP